MTSLPNSNGPCTKWTSENPRARSNSISGASNSRSSTASRKLPRTSASIELLALSRNHVLEPLFNFCRWLAEPLVRFDHFRRPDHRRQDWIAAIIKVDLHFV